VTNFQDLVANVKNLVALAPVLGAILHPVEPVKYKESHIFAVIVHVSDYERF